MILNEGATVGYCDLSRFLFPLRQSVLWSQNPSVLLKSINISTISMVSLTTKLEGVPPSVESYFPKTKTPLESKGTDWGAKFDDG